MANAKLIGACSKVALNKILAVKSLGVDSTEAPLLLFYAAENLVKAVLESEDVPPTLWRKASGNHQLGRMIDCLPDDCSIKDRLRVLDNLTPYATNHRYPSAEGKMPQLPKVEKIQEWYEATFEITEELFNHFKINPKDQQPVALRINPLRSSFPNITLG